MVSLSAKFFKALVSGLIKMDLLGDDSVTEAFIAEQIFAPNHVPHAEASDLKHKIKSILREAARANYTVAQLEKVLLAQSNIESKQELSSTLSFSQEQRDAFLSAWKSEARKVHAELVKRSDHTPGLRKTAWRVDVTTQSRHASELNEASAIIQLTAEAADKTANSFQFEMNRAELTTLMTSLNQINDAVQRCAGGQAKTKKGAAEEE